MQKRYNNKNILLYFSLGIVVFSIFFFRFSQHLLQKEKKFLPQISEKIGYSLDEIDEELFHIKNIIKVNDEKLDFSSLNQLGAYPFFIFHKQKMVYWSDYHFVPTYQQLSGTYTYKFITLNQGKYIVKKTSIGGNHKTYEIFTLLPLYFDANIENQYIKIGYNTDIFQSENVDIKISSNLNTENIIYTKGDFPLFSVSFGKSYKLANSSLKIFTLLLFLVAIIIYLIFIYKKIANFVAQKKIRQASVWLISGLSFLLLLIIYFDFPNSIWSNPLSKDKIFFIELPLKHLPVVTLSILDLLLISLLLLIIAWFLFKTYYLTKLVNKIFRSRWPYKYLTIFFLLLFCYFIFHLQYFLIKTLYSAPQWSLDITLNIDFSLSKIVILIIFIINAISYFIYAHISSKIIFHLLAHFQTSLLSFILINVIAALCLYIFHVFNITAFTIHFFYIFILYLFNFPKTIQKVQYKTFLYFFTAVISFSLFFTLLVYQFEKVSIIDNKQKFANPLLLENDVLSEFLLAQATKQIKKDPFILSQMSLPYSFSSSQQIKNRIKKVYLKNDFERYEVDIFLFDHQGNPYLNNALNTSYQEIKRKYAVPENDTEHDMLFFVDQIGSGMSKRYLQFIEWPEKINRYIIIELKLKKNISNSIYPALLVDLQPYLEKVFTYTTFSSDGELIYSSGLSHEAEKVFHSKEINNIELFEEGIIANGIHHFGVKGSVGKTIIVSSEFAPLGMLATNFSFIFLLITLTILLIFFIYALYFLLVKKERSTLAARIQLYLFLAFFVPLLVVSLSSLGITSATYQNNVEREYYEKAKNLSNQLNKELIAYEKNEISQISFSNHLTRVAKYIESDINLFNTSGELIAYSQPKIYEKGLLSRYINPEALAKLKEEKKDKVLLNESIGSLSYKSAYMAIYSDESGNLIGILSLPFFESKYELKQQIIQILSNILNIFTLIFIVFSLISYFVLNTLINPLNYITQKIKKTTLTGSNEPMVWNTNDEIGLMVGEYNKMLLKLEASREALSKSEKESAWREMAKQVAHEIKNPLTPMKLSLQHLKRTTNPEDKNTIKSIDSLLAQIDTLSDIATSFSSFAKMPIPKTSYFDIVPVIRDVVNLHSKKEKVQCEIELSSCYVLGDEKLMGRIFTNLIINGIQSVPESRDPEIKVSLSINNKNFAIIEVSDNGSGIPPEIQNKVFLPNFSTKYSGSGIGLAIAKRGIEHAGGKIWFETKKDQGTTFFIKLSTQLV